MKKIFLIYILLFTALVETKAATDSIHWEKSNIPHTIYVRLQLDQGIQLKYITQNILNTDSLLIDMVFKDCSAPTQLYDFDTLISIPSSQINPYYTFILRFVIDSNTVIGNCLIQNRMYDTLLVDNNAPLSISQSTFNNTLTLSPNPVQNILTLQSQEPMEQVSIYNMYGVLVQKQTYSEHINVAALRSGVYVLEARGKQGVWRSKFQKE